ncbi:cobalt transporter CbiM [Rhabdochromatium marinum]|uniref:cobalt transporter CbiM n=1 Tax=Rhabdochromatium marinum TaxID=48729 RepID=UPI001905E48F|nr:cobalamin biosynthesis protein CbiM [Rhabdochromatium marinum]
MAHIPDGVLAAPVLIGGGVVTLGLLTVALRRLDDQALPQAAVLSAAFFVISLISIPIGMTSVHLLLNGLMGLLLGWLAVPAILIALALQAVFFGHGGLLSLGVNTLNLAVPALLCGVLLRPWLHARGSGLAARPSPRRAFWVGALAGFVATWLTGLAVALALLLSGQALGFAARAIALAYVPLAGLEAVITATVLAFLVRVEPRLLGVPQEAEPEGTDT